MEIKNVIPSPVATKIINAIVAHNGTVIDDHGYGTKTIQIRGFGILTDNRDKQTVVALFDRSVGEYYSINSMAVDSDGVPHITRTSVGTMAKVTDSIMDDVQARHDSFDWEMISNRPAIHPGVISNVTVIERRANKATPNDFDVTKVVSSIAANIDLYTGKNGYYQNAAILGARVDSQVPGTLVGMALVTLMFDPSVYGGESEVTIRLSHSVSQVADVLANRRDGFPKEIPFTEHFQVYINYKCLEGMLKN